MRRHQSGTSKARPSWPFSRNRVTRHAGAGPGLRLKTAWLARGRRRWRLGRAGAVAVAFGPLVPQLSRWAPRPPNPFAAALPRFCPRAGTSCTRPPRGREPHSRVAKSLSRVVGARAALTRRCGPLKRSRLRLGKQQAGSKTNEIDSSARSNTHDALTLTNEDMHARKRERWDWEAGSRPDHTLVRSANAGPGLAAEALALPAAMRASASSAPVGTPAAAAKRLGSMVTLLVTSWVL